jgi:hypothetical protein
MPLNNIHGFPLDNPIDLCIRKGITQAMECGQNAHNIAYCAQANDQYTWNTV